MQKVGDKQVGERAVENFGIGGQSSRGDVLFGLAEGNNLSIINTFFCKQMNRKWVRKSPNGETKWNRLHSKCIVQDIELLGKVKNSDHSSVRH